MWQAARTVNSPAKLATNSTISVWVELEIVYVENATDKLSLKLKGHAFLILTAAVTSWKIFPFWGLAPTDLYILC